MKKIKKSIQLILITILVLTFFNQYSFAQMDKYSRKSVSFVEVLVYQGEKNHMNHNIEQQYLQDLRRGIHLDRFDINKLPDQINNKLRNTLNVITNDEKLTLTLESILLPEIQKILDVEKEIRARGFVSESERNSFIALKAKEYGVSSEHMIDVMNSAYIFLPYISDIKAKKHHKDKNEKDDKDKMQVTINGGLEIYKVNYTGDYSIKKVSTISSSHSSSKNKGSGSWEKAKNKAIIAIASSMAMNLKLELQKQDDFKLKTQLRKVKGLHVQFPLGKREGLKLDRPYYVGEWSENKRGVRIFKKDGFVRIGNVANNYNDSQALSTGYIIHKGNWARGMTLVEHPTSGIDFAFKPRIFGVEIDSGFFYLDEDDSEMAMSFSNSKSDLLGMDFDIQMNIAEQTKKLQSFMVLGGTVAFLSIENQIFDKDVDPFQTFESGIQDDNAAFYYNGYFGYLRKTYIGPIAFHREFLVGIQGINLDVTHNDEDYSISTIGFGGRINLGLEVALNIDWNLGIFGGYNYFPGGNIWTVQNDDNDEMDIETWDETNYPKMKSVSPTFGIYLHYSLPSFGSSSSKMVETASRNAMKYLF